MLHICILVTAIKFSYKWYSCTLWINTEWLAARFMNLLYNTPLKIVQSHSACSVTSEKSTFERCRWSRDAWYLQNNNNCCVVSATRLNQGPANDFFPLITKLIRVVHGATLSASEPISFAENKRCIRPIIKLLANRRGHLAVEVVSWPIFDSRKRLVAWDHSGIGLVLKRERNFESCLLNVFILFQARTTFNTDFQSHHQRWKNQNYDWLPKLPKDLGEHLSDEYIKSLEVNWFFYLLWKKN